ncbi:MAG: sigma-70 family RNA polymerase sigma factor [Frankia sp.]
MKLGRRGTRPAPDAAATPSTGPGPGDPAAPADRIIPAGNGRRSAIDDAVAAVYAEHGPAVFGYCLRLLGDRHLAQDAVQEVMIRMIRHPEVMDGDRGPIRPWLMTVARNVVIDSVRSRRSRPVEITGAPGETVMAAVPDAVSDAEIDRMLDSWQISEALRQLTPEHRAVLVHMYYLDRSVLETSRALGVPAGTVKSRTYYAMRSLRQVLRDDEVAP